MITKRHKRKTYHKRRLFSRLFLLFLLLLSVVYVFHRFIPKSISFTHTSPAKTIENTPIPQATTPLGKAVQTALNGSHGTYGIVIKNLKTGESYAMNEQVVFDSASLYKLWVMGTTYSQIQSGKIHETDMLSESVDQLNDELGIDPQDALLQKGKITLSVKNALQQMITISDNYDAELLTDKVKLKNVGYFLQTNDFHASTIGVNGKLPTTTAEDIAQFIEKLYDGKLANQTLTAEMLSLLQQQELNTKIPNNLPENVIIAHKTGELDEYSHDAGIVYTPKGNYIIVILSKSSNPPLAEERIANISLAVYNYFMNEN